MRKQIPLHTLVILRADGIGVVGAVTVRFVTRCEDMFIVVLDVS